MACPSHTRTTHIPLQMCTTYMGWNDTMGHRECNSTFHTTWSTTMKQYHDYDPQTDPICDMSQQFLMATHNCSSQH